MVSGRRTGWKVYTILLIIPLIILSVSMNCSNGYKLLTEDKGIAHFSFEYPADLNEETIRSSMDDYICVFIIRRVVKDGWWDKDLYVLAEKIPIQRFEAEIHDAVTMIEKYISDVKDSFEVFQVLEKSSVNIGGVSGEQVVYTFDAFSRRMPLLDAPLEGEPAGPSLVWIGRLICFDHNGLVWFIKMESTEETDEQTKLDFEHFIETFRILE